MGVMLVVLLQVLTSALRAQETSLAHIQALLVAEKVLQENCGAASLAAATYQGRDAAFDYLVRFSPQYELSNPSHESVGEVHPHPGDGVVAGAGPGQVPVPPDHEDRGAEENLVLKGRSSLVVVQISVSNYEPPKDQQGTKSPLKKGDLGGFASAHKNPPSPPL